MSGSRWWIFFGAALVAAAGAAGALAEDKGEARVDAAGRVKRVMATLEEMRGKKFKHEVGVETQSAEEFRKFVDREIDKELPPEKAAAMARALEAFELLPKGYDLRKGLSDLYVSQAGAYYNPETKTFYMLMVQMPDDVLDAMILHELTHALQDQYHDLKPALRRLSEAGNDDAASAFQFLVEGEATYTMTRFQLKGAGMNPDQLGPMGDLVFGRMRDMDRRQLAQQGAMLQGTLGPGADEIKKSLAALDKMPNYLFWSLHAPYLRGQYAVYEVQKAGWPAVDGLFESAPASTEQMMHPEKLSGAGKDDPTPVALPLDPLKAALGEGFKLLHSNVMGEFGTFILMDEKLPAEPVNPFAPAGGPPARRARVAAGWDGDRFAVFEDGGRGGGLALVWKTVWDSEDDAKEFAGTMKEIGYKDGVVLRGREVLVHRGLPAASRAKVLGLLAEGGGGTVVR